jgi:hypothetical protein
MHWPEASWLELTVSENSKFYPLKIDLRTFGLVLLVLILVFWYQPKLGFNFPDNLATEKVCLRCQRMR